MLIFSSVSSVVVAVELEDAVSCDSLVVVTVVLEAAVFFDSSAAVTEEVAPATSCGFS